MSEQINSTTWAEANQPGIKHWFSMGLEEQPDVLPLIYNMQSSSTSDEKVQMRGGMSGDSWEQFSKNKQIPEVGVDLGYKTTFTHKTYLKKLVIERELIEDERYNQINALTMEFGESLYRFRQNQGVSTFVNAFSASFLGADGVALCSDSHPGSPNSAATQDNNDTLALTKANLSTIRLRMMSFEDDKGNIAGIVPDTVVVPKELVETISDINNSLLDPTSANNTHNFHSGRWNVITSQYMTDTNAWFMVDSRAMKRNHHWFERIAPTINLEVGDTNVWTTWIARNRFVRGFSDWRWIYGNNPS